jgi:hypothetical protein
MPSPADSPTAALVASNLDRAIKVAGRTNRDVGEAIGATEHQVWRWRNGRNVPSDDYAVALASELFAGDLSALYAKEAA